MSILPKEKMVNCMARPAIQSIPKNLWNEKKLHAIIKRKQRQKTGIRKMGSSSKYFSMMIPEMSGIKTFKKGAVFQTEFSFPLPTFVTG